ncbi:MAG TPA: NUDIX hydrolase [Candidatus Bathyarchaeia archaeon]|nr:NUDIX hydrolase [Candidatus Bathyarchaeia archaeon]
MLKIKPPNFRFCPFCAKKLQVRSEEERKRKYCSLCSWTYYPHAGSAAAAIIIRDRKVLMVKRRREPYKDYWMFPAGFIEFGEHPLEALKREINEETGLRAKKASLLDIIQSIDDGRSPGHFIFFYQVTTTGVTLKTDKEENQDIAWIEIDRPPEKIGWQAHRLMLKRLQEKA